MEDTSSPGSSAITEVVIPAPRAGADSVSETIQKSKMSLEGFTDTEPVPMLGDWNPTAAGEDVRHELFTRGFLRRRTHYPGLLDRTASWTALDKGEWGKSSGTFLEANRIVVIKCMHAGASGRARSGLRAKFAFYTRSITPMCAVYDSGVTEEGTP